MVEFGLTITVFVFIVLACVNLILIGYNLDTAQRAAWEAARKAAVGASNSQIADVIYDQFATKMFSSFILISKPNFDPTSFVVPNDLLYRVEGFPVQINLGYTTGMSLGPLGNLELTFPVSSKLRVITHNDEDQDGLNDAVEAFPNDHDNDGIVDSSDSDVDNDGIIDSLDKGTIRWNGAAYVINTGSGEVPNPSLANGRFATRILWPLSDGSTFVENWPYLPRAIPRDLSGVENTNLYITVDLSYDADNDGWSDRYVPY
ncbi:MAG: hypothetical protein D6679_04730 [Candidatus Hydrogenedentota bacterium]|nr:MAG: hypothetical protein D6679_04730 [Candidatus Hydrogenedentota bacterium]